MVCGTGFSLGNFRFTFHVFCAFSLVSLTESCSFWHGLNDLSPLHKLNDKVVLDG